MNNILISLQAITGLLLVLAILVQVRGKGFARSWGSSGSFTRRGLEKVVFKMTFVIAFIFIAVSIISIAI
jgi:protein translocase SecG subunit